MVTVSDKKLGQDTGSDDIADYYEAIVTTASDYYPFGWQMPNRKLNAGNYSFGFNGQLQDSEWMGGQSVSFEFRTEDPRIGRFLSTDPLTALTPWESPYVFAGNDPIANIDYLGLIRQNAKQQARAEKRAVRKTKKEERKADKKEKRANKNKDNSRNSGSNEPNKEDTGRDNQGNLIFTPTEKEALKRHYNWNEETQTGHVYEAIIGKILLNDGTEVEARLVYKKEVYKVDKGQRSLSEKHCASPNCTGLVFTGNDNIVLNASSVDDDFLKEEGYVIQNYWEAWHNPNDKIIGLYYDLNRVTVHAEQWTGTMKDYFSVSSTGYFEGGRLPEVISKGGITQKETALQGKTWDKTHYYGTYLRVGTDQQVSIQFSDEGSTHGVSHGVKGGVRVVSPEEFDKAQKELTPFYLFDYKR